MADEEKSIKNLTELIEASFDIGILLATNLKDGAQVADLEVILATLTTDQVLVGKLIAAADDIGKVPGEASDIDLMEAMAIGMMVLKYIPKFLEAIKKDETNT